MTSSGIFSRLFQADPKSLPLDVQKKSGHVIPGLWDGHGHLLQYGELLSSVNLFGVESLDEVVDRVVVYSKSHSSVGSAKEWIRGTGWDQAAFGRYPVSVSSVQLVLRSGPALSTPIFAISESINLYRGHCFPYS